MSLSIYTHVENWLIIPFTTCAILCYIWGVDILIKKTSVAFPASVACMILLFLILLISNTLLGSKRTSSFIALISPTTDFLLKWINILFSPAFILLPTSPSIGLVEIGKVAAVFVVGFLLFLSATGGLVRVLSILKQHPKRDADIEDDKRIVSQDNNTLEAPQKAETLHTKIISNSEQSLNLHDSIPPNTPGLGLAESMNIEEIQQLPEELDNTDHMRMQSLVDANNQNGQEIEIVSRSLQTNHLSHTLTLYDSTATTIPHVSQSTSVTQINLPSPHSRTFNYLRHNFTSVHLVYLTLFVISLAVYLSPLSITLPVHLTLTVLAFFIGMSVPLRIRFYLHPIITCSAITMAGIYILALAKRHSFLQGLGEFSTGSKYLIVLEGLTHGKSLGNGLNQIPFPGAGDVLLSLLDASIVSFGVGMFRYRGELRAHFFEIITTIIIMAWIAIFVYPLAARGLGISPTRALAFAGRSVTTPLAIPLMASLHGDVTFTVCLVILTGISGTIVSPWMLKNVVRVKEDDYLTIGVAMGTSSHGISTAFLLTTNPRAAAVASVSFVLFGTVCNILVNIPAVAKTLDQLVGL